MSSQQYSETQRPALEQAQEGHRLLCAGDYKGAIKACTEAIEVCKDSIELEPRIQGAYRTRAEALNHIRVNSASTTWKNTRDAKEVPSGRSTLPTIIAFGSNPFVIGIFLIVTSIVTGELLGTYGTVTWQIGPFWASAAPCLGLLWGVGLILCELVKGPGD